MALSRRSHAAYARLLDPISHDDAQAEPEVDRIFVEPAGAYPKISISTVVEIDGLSLNITINDTSISDAVALMRRRGARPAGTVPPAPGQARHTARRARTAAPTVIWSDIDDQPGADSGEQIIQAAQQLLAAGQARGWSHALETARKYVK
jgi:hypothetical protein